MNRTVLKHLKALEEKLEEQDRNDENVTEILELLLQYENAMEPLQLTLIMRSWIWSLFSQLFA